MSQVIKRGIIQALWFYAFLSECIGVQEGIASPLTPFTLLNSAHEEIGMLQLGLIDLAEQDQS